MLRTIKLLHIDVRLRDPTIKHLFKALNGIEKLHDIQLMSKSTIHAHMLIMCVSGGQDDMTFLFTTSCFSVFF